jgi:hypothetical protein
VSRRRGQGGGSAGWGAEQGRRSGDNWCKGAGSERGRRGGLEVAGGDGHRRGAAVELFEDFLEVLEAGGGHDIAAKGIQCLRETKSARVYAEEAELSTLGGEEGGGHLADGGTTKDA